MLIFTLLMTAVMVSFSGTAFISSFSRALASCCRVSSSTACTAARKTTPELKSLLLQPATLLRRLPSASCCQGSIQRAAQQEGLGFTPKDVGSPASCCCCVSTYMACPSTALKPPCR